MGSPRFERGSPAPEAGSLTKLAELPLSDNLTSLLRYNYIVFAPCPAESGDVHAGLRGYDHVLLELQLRPGREARSVVHLYSDRVAQGVYELALVLPSVNGIQVRSRHLVDLAAGQSRPYAAYGPALRLLDYPEHLLLFPVSLSVRASEDEGPRHVAAVVVHLRAGVYQHEVPLPEPCAIGHVVGQRRVLAERHYRLKRVPLRSQAIGDVVEPPRQLPL